MKRTVLVLAAAFALSCSWRYVGAQRPGLPQVEQDVEAQRIKITGERVIRQAEVLRLEQMIERLEGRVVKLERRLLGTDRFPAVTIFEAEAALSYARYQLQESERRHAADGAPKSEVEFGRLGVVRARAQLALAQAAHRDRLLALEVERLDAQSRLAAETTRLAQLERLLAKGVGAAEGLQRQKLKLSRARAELARVDARIKLQQELGSNSQRPE